MKKTVYIPGGAERFANYRRAVEAAGGRAVFGSETAGQAALWDALLLPGGGDLDPERDRAELALLGEFAGAGKPVLGVCRGLQCINVFFGGTLIQDVPGHGAAGGADRLHPLRTAPSPLPFPGGEGPLVNSAHHQAADRLGDGLRAVQWAPDGVVEALCHRSLPLWAVQWHPERLTASGAGRRLLGAFLELEPL